ncbi:MAG: hypothetical protein ACYC7J_06685 [Syntrophales bacterium]
MKSWGRRRKSIGTGNGFSRPNMVDHFPGKAVLVFGIGTRFTRAKFITPIPEEKTIAPGDPGRVGHRHALSDLLRGVVGDAGAVILQMIGAVDR